MKLIDKSALVAEIEKLKAYLLIPNAQLEAIQVCDNVISVINTLEVKEVDFIKEFYTFSEKHKLMDKDIEFSDIEKTASFFFQLGLKTQKGDEV